MGALTNNRKRGEEFFTLLHSPPLNNSYCFHKSKKPRFSMHQTPEKPVVSSNSTASRLARYPEIITKIRRELHAPCRTVKYGLPKRFSVDSGIGTSTSSEFAGGSDGMGNRLTSGMRNLLSKNYSIAKKIAFGALRYLTKDKEVIDVDNQPQNQLDIEDSSVEFMEEDSRESPSMEVVDAKGKKIVEEASVVMDTSNGDVQVDNSEKMLDLLSLDKEIKGVSSVEVYKKLLETAERRSSKIRALDYQIEFNEKKLSCLQSLRPVKKPEEKPVEEISREPFIPLTKEEEEHVQSAFSSNRRKVLVNHEKSGIEITGQILQCLRPGAWLNDEVINLYLELLKEREMREPKKFLRCHFFNTFFYKKLTSGRTGYDYRAVKRWTTLKKLGYNLIDCEKIFVPIHKEIHWCLAIINKKDEKFQYLDSLGGKDGNVLKALAKYFVEEVKDKNGQDIDVRSWDLEFIEDLPEQQNGFDCGMFMIKYADFYSRGQGVCFNQEQMPYFRKRTAKELLNLRAE